MININKTRLYFILISILIILSDQLFKYIIEIDNFKLLDKELIIFTIVKVKNYGAAFNIFDGNRVFLSFTSFVFSILLIYLLIRKNETKNIDLYSYTFLLGGTIGNGIDRIFKGYVIDFINLNFINFPVFNIADISINIGFILILYSLVKSNS